MPLLAELSNTLDLNESISSGGPYFDHLRYEVGESLPVDVGCAAIYSGPFSNGDFLNDPETYPIVSAEKGRQIRRSQAESLVPVVDDCFVRFLETPRSRLVILGIGDHLS